MTKKKNKHRLIVDLRALNTHIKVPCFKNEGIDTVCDQLQVGDQFVSIDLKDGFHHVPVNEAFQTFLGFQWENVYYVFTFLCFGLNISPFYFNKTIRAVVQYIRSQGIRYSSFVDDGLLLSKPKIIQSHKDFLLKTYLRLGFVINWEEIGPSA